MSNRSTIIAQTKRINQKLKTILSPLAATLLMVPIMAHTIDGMVMQDGKMLMMKDGMMVKPKGME